LLSLRPAKLLQALHPALTAILRSSGTQHHGKSLAQLDRIALLQIDVFDPRQKTRGRSKQLSVPKKQDVIDQISYQCGCCAPCLGVEWETEGGGMLLGRRVRVGLVRAALITASKYVSIFSNAVLF
jgi:hypothetical protein